MTIAPAPRFPENPGYTYERKMAPGVAGGRGPLRFEEGLATDTDIPGDFQQGMMEGAVPAPGHPNFVNPATQYKHADQTMRERAHVGSAAWVESPTFLADYAGGAGEGNVIQYIQVDRGEGRKMRGNAATVND